jgi:hypothetical protein
MKRDYKRAVINLMVFYFQMNITENNLMVFKFQLKITLTHSQSIKYYYKLIN